VFSKSVATLLTSLTFLGVSCVAYAADPCKAQVTCAIYSLDQACTPKLPPGATNCIGIAPWTAQCEVFNDRCAPHNAAAETCPACSGSAAPVSNPVSMSTGNTYVEQSDLRIPGLSQGLSLSRTWNSVWPSSQNDSRIGRFGLNWRSSYEERVFLGSDGYMKYARSDGSFWSFGFTTYESDQTFLYHIVAPANQSMILESGTSSWKITFKDGEKRLFDNASGLLVSIIDRNGNATGLSYDGQNRLATVTDPSSRHLSFSYVSGSSPLVQAVTSDVGVSLSYAYDDQQRLTKVTNPDNTFQAFEYDANSMLTAVKDSEGKVIESHTYDVLGRGLTSSRANGIESVGISYP
jgi:YD repeat-containing protein